MEGQTSVELGCTSEAGEKVSARLLAVPLSAFRDTEEMAQRLCRRCAMSASAAACGAPALVWFIPISMIAIKPSFAIPF